MKLKIAFGIFFINFFFLSAQENKLETNNEPEFFHKISIVMQQAHIPKITEDSFSKKKLVVPAWGIDYDFWFNKKWAIGLHSNLVIEQYEVKKETDGTIIERENPFSTTLVGIYKPFNHWSFLLGFGKEFAKTENLGLMNLGLEYGIELPKEWELSFNLEYENKFNTYDTWLFGIGISKFFNFKK